MFLSSLDTSLIIFGDNLIMKSFDISSNSAASLISTSLNNSTSVDISMDISMDFSGKLNFSDLRVNVSDNEQPCTTISTQGSVEISAAEISMERNSVSADANSVSGGLVRTVYTTGTGSQVALTSKRESLAFKNNKVENVAGAVNGGLVWAGGQAALTSELQDVVFENNEIYASNSGIANVTGGLIYGSDGSVTISAGQSLCFKNMTVSAESSTRSINPRGSQISGGLIYSPYNITLTARSGDLLFEGNKVSVTVPGNHNFAQITGGLIRGNGVVLNAGGDMTFSNDISISTDLGANSIYGDWLKGGAIYSYGGATLSASGDISFATTLTVREGFDVKGGAIYAVNDVELSADKDINFSGARSDVYSENGSIIVRSKNLSADHGVEFTVSGDQSVGLGVGSLTVSASSVSEDLFTIRAKNLYIGKGLSTDKAVSVDLRVSAAEFGADGSLRADFMRVGNDGNIDGIGNFNAAKYRDGSVTSSDVDGYKILTLTAQTAKLTWNGAEEDRWENYSGGWLNDSSHSPDVFYASDSVTFSGAAENKNVAVSGSVYPAAMTVTGGDYIFGGSDSITTGRLTLSGGSAKFTNGITVTGTFEAQAGSTLIINGAAAQSGFAVTGDGAATLTVAGGAVLKVEGAALDCSYKVLTGFAGYGDAKLWKITDGSTDYTEFSSWAGGVLTLTGTPTPSFKPRFLSTGGTALVITGAFMENTGARVLSLLQGEMGGAGLAKAAAMGFLPRGDKSRSVWAAMNYGKNRVDGMKIGDKRQDMDTTVYGVTIGADQSKNGTAIGLALDLGKYESDGKGQWSGASADGKYIGLAAYAGRRLGKWDMTGTASVHWLKNNMNAADGSNAYRVNDMRSQVASLGLKGYYNALYDNGHMRIAPFIGVRFTHYSESGYDMLKNGSLDYRGESEGINQWTFPLGVKFDWYCKTAGSGWNLSPSLEVAYVRAAGDLDYRSRASALSGSPSEFLTTVTDENSFRTSLSFEAKKKDFTLKLNLKGQFSSGQKDIGGSALLKWEF